MFFKNFTTFRLLDAFRVSRERHSGTSEPRDFTALAMRISGESTFRSGGESYTACAGSVIYIPTGVGFSRVGKDDEELIILHLCALSDEGNKIELTYPQSTAEVAEAFNKIYEEWSYKRDGFEFRASSILYGLIDKLRSQSEGSEPYRRSIIEAGAELINLNFSDRELSVSRLAAACNMSAEYFRKLYKAEYGISPYTAILEKRLGKAKGLLESGYFSVQQVAEESGFSNVKHFSTAFRKKIGRTPSEYKQSLQKE